MSMYEPMQNLQNDNGYIHEIYYLGKLVLNAKIKKQTGTQELVEMYNQVFNRYDLIIVSYSRIVEVKEIINLVK